MENDPQFADPPQGSAPMDEQLVSYLDGELDDKSSRLIEEQLTSDSALREQLSRLERTWDALDELEQIEVDEGFTKTTIEMVALVAEEDRQRADDKRPAQRRRQWLLGSAGLLAACLAGFVATSNFWHDPDEQLINDLPVLERLYEYQQVKDIEFLKLLHEKRLFSAEAPDDDA